MAMAKGSKRIWIAGGMSSGALRIATAMTAVGAVLLAPAVTAGIPLPAATVAPSGPQTLAEALGLVGAPAAPPAAPVGEAVPAPEARMSPAERRAAARLARRSSARSAHETATSANQPPPVASPVVPQTTELATPALAPPAAETAAQQATTDPYAGLSPGARRLAARRARQEAARAAAAAGQQQVLPTAPLQAAAEPAPVTMPAPPAVATPETAVPVAPDPYAGLSPRARRLAERRARQEAAREAAAAEQTPPIAPPAQAAAEPRGFLFFSPTPAPEAAPAAPAAPEVAHGDARHRHASTPAEPAEDISVTVPESMVREIAQATSADLQEVLKHFQVVLVVNKAECPYSNHQQCASAQKARFYRNGALQDVWPVSTGTERLKKPPYSGAYVARTPVGWHSPQVLDANHYSNLWDAPMPWAVFFAGGIAVHATNSPAYRNLGHRASGGCVRLHANHAETFFRAIREAGTGQVPVYHRGGGLLRSGNGQVQTHQSYNTLIIVENVPEGTST